MLHVFFLKLFPDYLWLTELSVEDQCSRMRPIPAWLYENWPLVLSSHWTQQTQGGGSALIFVYMLI